MVGWTLSGALQITDFRFTFGPRDHFALISTWTPPVGDSKGIFDIVSRRHTWEMQVDPYDQDLIDLKAVVNVLDLYNAMFDDSVWPGQRHAGFITPCTEPDYLAVRKAFETLTQCQKDILNLINPWFEIELDLINARLLFWDTVENGRYGLTERDGMPVSYNVAFTIEITHRASAGVMAGTIEIYVDGTTITVDLTLSNFFADPWPIWLNVGMYSDVHGPEDLLTLLGALGYSQEDVDNIIEYGIFPFPNLIFINGRLELFVFSLGGASHWVFER